MIRILYFSGSFVNRHELMEELGMIDGTEKDILALGFETEGKAFLTKLNGLFAFALLDERSGCSYCCRDRFGGKGLYYTISPEGRVFFAGTIREVISEAQLTPTFCEEMLEVYLSFAYVPGEQTMIQSVKKPLPGYLYCFSFGKVKRERYFTPKYRIEKHTDEEWEERLFDVFQSIWKGREKGGSSLLSSGIDSAYLCKSLSVRDTYTASYPEESFSESDVAEEFSKDIGALHHKVEVTPEAYLALVSDVMRALEQPTGDASAVVLLLLFQEIAKSTDECYSGEGIDELFMGYYLKIVKNIPKNQTLLDAEYLGCTRMFSEEEKKRFLKHYNPSRKMEYVKEALYLSEGEDRLNQAALVDLMVWLNGSLLPNLYGIGLAAGLKVITPYFDTRLYDITMTIPSDKKHDREQTKKMFRKVVGRSLGSVYANRPKLGFPVPIRLWIRRPDYAKQIRRAFQSDTAARFFKCEELTKYYDTMLANPDDRDSWYGIWCIYCFIIWYEKFVSAADWNPEQDS